MEQGSRSFYLLSYPYLVTLEQVRDLLHPLSLFGEFLDAVGLVLELLADALALVAGLETHTADQRVGQRSITMGGGS